MPINVYRMIIRNSYKYTDTVQDSMALSVGAFASGYDGRPFLMQPVPYYYWLH